MNSEMLKAIIGYNRDTQMNLAEACGLSLSAFNAKLNGHADFRRDEIMAIKQRYNLTAVQIDDIFFANEVSKKDT